jgi:hypothetical protein
VGFGSFNCVLPIAKPWFVGTLERVGFDNIISDVFLTSWSSGIRRFDYKTYANSHYQISLNLDRNKLSPLLVTLITGLIFVGLIIDLGGTPTPRIGFRVMLFQKKNLG